MLPTNSPFPRHLHSTDWIVDKACNLLETRERSKPFALWVSLLDPHPPLVIHEPNASMYSTDKLLAPIVPHWVDTELEPFEQYFQWLAWIPGPLTAQQIRHARAAYDGIIADMRQLIGRLLGKVAACGDLSDTLVVSTSDHGEALGDCGTLGKRSFFEHSAKFKLTVRPPTSWEIEPGRQFDDLVEMCDLLPAVQGERMPPHAPTPRPIHARAVPRRLHALPQRCVGPAVLILASAARRLCAEGENGCYTAHR